MWRRLALLASAVLLGGAGIVSDGEQTTLPVSSSAGLPVMTPTAPDQMPWAADDAGMLWLPTPWAEYGADAGAADGGRRTDAGPPVDAGPPGPCAPLEEQIAHRREFLSGVWLKGTQVESGVETKAYCEQHPGEVECSRPPTYAERDISEAIDEGDEKGPEVDAWIIRWGQELKECRTAHPPAVAPRPPRAASSPAAPRISH